MRQENPRIDLNANVMIPARMHPLFRTEHAIQNGYERNLLFRTYGGLGDQICAEPTLRYALKMFKGCEISLVSENPELFSHLKFHRVYSIRKGEKPDYDKHLLFDTITPPNDTNMVWLFFSHLLTNCVDFASMCALRLQLPIADKEIDLSGEVPMHQAVHLSIEDTMALNHGVFVHPGRHWQIKTFPESFWNRVLAGLLARGIKPVLIGGDADDNRGTVAVNAEGCLDLRNKLTIPESIGLLKQASVLLTNDSAPLHMAAAGRAYIGYVATVKHPDMITHWRQGEFQWREKNFGKGGLWEHVDYCPNKAQTVETERVDPKLLESWLPDPYEMSEWATRMKKEYD